MSPTDARRRVDAVERSSGGHEALERDRIEPDHRIQLHDEQRDVRTHQRTRDQRIVSMRILHRRDYNKPEIYFSRAG